MDEVRAVPADAARDRSLGRDLFALALASAVFFGIALGERDLWNPNEPTYGRATVEMYESGEWLTPTIHGQLFAEKPILYYWIALAASHLRGGVDESTLRAPSTLAAIASVLLIYLLVLPYTGRRHALLAAASMATMYQVFWAGRAVQMDILVLATTLGALVPLSRMLDFGWSAHRAWAWAGFASGLGLAAKGPVGPIIPGLAIAAYALSDRRFGALARRGLWVGGLTGFAVGAPWYLLLWARGETGALYEVFWRQNFERFSTAWDHHQPWWYFLKYVWVDYLPWVLLLPAAIWTMRATSTERRLRRLCWIWIATTIAFFSLSDSKRAPYILPVAPAIAVLVASVIEAWSCRNLPRPALRAARGAFAGLGAILAVAGLYALWTAPSQVPPDLATVLQWGGGLLAATGVVVASGVAVYRRVPVLAPAGLLIGMVGLCLTASIWVLPEVDPMKSARTFSSKLEDLLEAKQGTLASYGMWRWRGEYAYYLGASIRGLESRAAVREFWATQETPYVLVEARGDASAGQEAVMASLLTGAEVVLQQEVGRRTVTLFGKAPVRRMSTAVGKRGGIVVHGTPSQEASTSRPAW